MIFAVSSDCFEWSLDFGSDSIMLNLIDLKQKLTISSQETPLVACSLLVFQRQNISNNHLASSIYFQPSKDYEDEDELLARVGGDKAWTQASMRCLIWGYWAWLRGCWFEYGCSLPTRHKYSLFPSNFNDAVGCDGFFIWSAHCLSWDSLKFKQWLFCIALVLKVT